MILDLVALQILAASTFFSGTWKYPRIVDVFGTLDRIYQDLQYKNREVKIQVKVIVVLTVTALLFLANFANIVMNNGLDFSVLNFFTFLLLDCTQLAFLLQFTHVTESIITGFKTVSNKMREEIICNLIERTVMQRSLGDGHICHTTRNTVSKIKKVKSLMNTYWILCDVVHQANDFYCDQLMAVMFSIFVQVTIKSYFFFMNVRSGYLFAFTMDAVWVLVLICYAILVANSSTEITNSADNTAVMICKLINKDLDPSLRKQLEGFLLQLPHHNARLSARGFFQIHNETLTSMAGAVTTYLVILIQFQTEK
ncbi:putative gustatory receptor 28b [Homalodisca vitripennis]|uniref:putative gustatory receptor 28b n=1 Tax=Homalodisca vitripennis TaxID=197043 RepID=UPI001EEB7CE3|nr:putative gustatory receptor 28b [Homalodisca vitripennis]